MPQLLIAHAPGPSPAVPIFSHEYEEEKKVIKVTITGFAQIQEMGKSLIDSKAFFCML